MQQLGAEYEIPIQLNKTALEEAGIGTDSPVNIALHNISLRSALRLLLKNFQLTYIIQDEVLIITTKEDAEKDLVVKVYPVADLVLPIDASQLGGQQGPGRVGVGEVEGSAEASGVQSPTGGDRILLRLARGRFGLVVAAATGGRLLGQVPQDFLGALGSQRIGAGIGIGIGAGFALGHQAIAGWLHRLTPIICACDRHRADAAAAVGTTL